jgi:hypothetical protein
MIPEGLLTGRSGSSATRARATWTSRAACARVAWARTSASLASLSSTCVETPSR